MTISLYEARTRGQLSEFAAQETKRGIGPISKSQFEKDATTLVKAQPPQDQTSGSHGRGNLSGKKTR